MVCNHRCSDTPVAVASNLHRVRAALRTLFSSSSVETNPRMALDSLPPGLGLKAQPPLHHWQEQPCFETTAPQPLDLQLQLCLNTASMKSRSLPPTEHRTTPIRTRPTHIQ